MEPMKRPDWSREQSRNLRWVAPSSPVPVKNAPGEWVLHPSGLDCSRGLHHFVRNERVAWVDRRQWVVGQGMTVCRECGAEGYDNAPWGATGTWRYWPCGVPDHLKHLPRKKHL